LYPRYAEIFMARPKRYRFYIELDELESRMVRQLQEDLREHLGRKMTVNELVRGYVRQLIHDYLGIDYGLPVEMRTRLRELAIELSAEERMPGGPRAS
jgi:hypothetical protein